MEGFVYTNILEELYFNTTPTPLKYRSITRLLILNLFFNEWLIKLIVRAFYNYIYHLCQLIS